MADAQHTIGQIIDEASGRDAVHFALAPAVAAEILRPGQHVGLAGADVLMAEPNNDPLGIVDPFLKEPVQPGERFWLFLYPNSITGLRHEWTHPAFDKELALRADAVAERLTGTSEAWLRDFCRKADCPNYETVIAAISGKPLPDNDDDYYSFRWEDYGEGPVLFFHGKDAHSSIPPEFWDHAEIITGIKFGPDMRATGFACSC